MSAARCCDGTHVLNCIFDFVDTDGNGLVSLLEFSSFCIKEARQCHVDSEELRAHFHAIDCDGSGGLDFAEFEEFISDMVCMTEIEAKQHHDETEEQHKQGLLTMAEALTIYITQQVKLHKKALQEAADPSDIVCPTKVPLDGAGLLERQKLALDYLVGSIDPDAKAVLDFWFPESLTEAMMLWFGKSPALDDDIRNRFGGLVELAAKGDLDSWTSDPIECLALIILLDQFPRNIYRHQKRMYDTDAKAQSICMKVLYHNYHRTITPLQAIFMPCLVLTHSEHFHHQELCVDIWCHLIQHSLPVDDQLRIFGMIFLNHLKVVAKFGRFPHRNEIMGRKTTKEEEDFLNDKSFRFDLPLHYTPDGRVVFEETDEFKAKAEETAAPVTAAAPPAVKVVEKKPTNNNDEEREVEQDSPELKKCLLTTLKEWKDTLEKKFSDSDAVIDQKCGKSAVVETSTSGATVGKEECSELRFGEAAAPANESQNGGSVQWTRSTKAQRDTRKSMMAKLLTPS